MNDCFKLRMSYADFELLVSKRFLILVVDCIQAVMSEVLMTRMLFGNAALLMIGSGFGAIGLENLPVVQLLCLVTQSVWNKISPDG